MAAPRYGPADTRATTLVTADTDAAGSPDVAEGMLGIGPPPVWPSPRYGPADTRGPALDTADTNAAGSLGEALGARHWLRQALTQPDPRVGSGTGATGSSLRHNTEHLHS